MPYIYLKILSFVYDISSYPYITYLDSFISITIYGYTIPTPQEINTYEVPLKIPSSYN